MVFTKLSVPPGPLFYFFITALLIVHTACHIPPGRPVIVITPSSGKVGISATVRCSSQGGDPTPTVKINRNSVLIDDSATTTNGETVNDYTFTVQDGDQYATFECFVANGVLQNPLTATAYFIVFSNYSANVPPSKPVITITPSPVRIGTSATVRCTSVGGDPTPTVKISRNGVLVDDTATTTNGRTVNDYTFTVHDTDHYAMFECSVANGVLQNSLTETEYLIIISSNTTLVPAGRPVIVMTPSSGTVGTSATVGCSSVGGDPTPTVKISRNGVLEDDTATTTAGQTVNNYTFTVQESDHYAVFECSVANGVLQNPLTSTEYFFVVTTPQAPTLNGPTVVTTGTGSQNWTCISRNGYPMQTMTMRNDNTQFTSGFTTSAIINSTPTKYTVTGTLIWTPLLGDNGHTIHCDVSHTTLTLLQTVSLPLTVTARLEVSAPITSYIITIGTRVTLNCVVKSGIATSITWLKENIPITISTKNRLSGGTVATPPLTITNVQQSDQGNYTCQARDPVGTTVITNTIILSLQGDQASEKNTTIASLENPPFSSETETTVATSGDIKIDTTEEKELFIAGIITLSVGLVVVIVGAVVVYIGCLYRKRNRAANYIDLKISNHSITEPYSTLNQPEYVEIQDLR